jgi:lipid-A-disaccharide synthase
MRIAIVCGEPSGDVLGADLIRALKQRCPDAEFYGIGGPAMIAEGFTSLYPLEVLSVMGLVEVLKDLPRLLRIRRELTRRLIAERPDAFIGIDAPDFNLGVERRLREAGLKTVHYVSPTVWAWREGRIKGIRRAVDLILTVFPFEANFYDGHNVPAVYVGHPAADRLPLEVDPQRYRQRLGLNVGGPVVAVLPGSRRGELERLGPLFADTVARIKRELPECTFIAPMVSAARRAQFEQALTAAGISGQVRLLDGDSELAMGAADCVLLASGTATLEALLLKRPMVVGYKVAPLTATLVRALGLMKIKHFAMANLVAGEEVVPEFIQERAEAGAMAAAVVELLRDPARRERISARFMQLHRELKRNASARAAEAVLQCLS